MPSDNQAPVHKQPKKKSGGRESTTSTQGSPSFGARHSKMPSFDTATEHDDERCQPDNILVDVAAMFYHRGGCEVKRT